MSLKCFSIINSCGHFVQWSGTIFAILVESYLKKHFCKLFLNSGHCSRRRRRLKKLLTDGRRTNIDHNSSP